MDQAWQTRVQQQQQQPQQAQAIYYQQPPPFAAVPQPQQVPRVAFAYPAPPQAAIAPPPAYAMVDAWGRPIQFAQAPMQSLPRASPSSPTTVAPSSSSSSVPSARHTSPVRRHTAPVALPPSAPTVPVAVVKEREYSFFGPPRNSAMAMSCSELAPADLRGLFDRLYVPEDFSRLASCCHGDPESIAGLVTTTNPQRVRFRIVNADESAPAAQTPAPSPTVTASGVSFSVRVVPVLGVPLAPTFAELARGREDDHLRKQIKFLVGRKDRGLNAIGGPWVAELDGQDPTDQSTLIKTATRTAKEQIGIDLDGCKRWIRFMEVWYQRQPDGASPSPERTDVTVIFIPTIEDLAAPSKGTGEPCVTVEKRGGARPMQISFDGLLDYNNEDTLERTFEVSLFAELFHMSLCKSYGHIIFDVLSKFKTTPAPVTESAAPATASTDATSAPKDSEGEKGEKRQLEQEQSDSKPAEEVPEKRQKLDEAPAGAKEEHKEDAAMSQAKVKPIEAEVKAKEEPKAQEEVAKPSAPATEGAKKPMSPDDTLACRKAVRAFQYFDKAMVGFIRPMDTEAILHSLGMFLTRRRVHFLVDRAYDDSSSSSHRNPRIHYLPIISSTSPLL